MNNQINEALIILRTLTGWYAKNGGKGWPNHPFVLRWRGYELALAGYTYECLVEWVRRSEPKYRVERMYLGEKRLDNISDAIGEEAGIRWQIGAYKTPEWLNEDFCREHRQLLLEKDFAFYSKKFEL